MGRLSVMLLNLRRIKHSAKWHFLLLFIVYCYFCNNKYKLFTMTGGETCHSVHWVQLLIQLNYGKSNIKSMECLNYRAGCDSSFIGGIAGWAKAGGDGCIYRTLRQYGTGISYRVADLCQRCGSL